ncbi:MAG TPA: histidine kinase [Bacteroidia bacterium]|nr:histidine kinase [Bacteroidia bacterium]
MSETRFLGMNRQQLYWSCQLGGWSLFVLLQGFFLSLKGGLNPDVEFVLIAIFILGILLTQLLRWFIIRFKWQSIPFVFALPRVILFDLLMGGVVSVSKFLLEKSIFTNKPSADPVKLSLDGLNFSIFFFFWTILYFLVHFIENYKKAEIEKLKWEAAITEAALNKLKSQLNPHFMFNAMNSIRALVGENPARAKDAVTQFSNLMRNTLQMGKQKLVPFSKEMEVVNDYIAIESVRLEERLKVKITIADDCNSFEVPPLMIQTLVENGIKHGIAKLPEGGELSLDAKIDHDVLHVVIENSGKYDEHATPESGFGLRNTKERLHLLYNENAAFSIVNEPGNKVRTELTIPKLQKS